MAVTGRGGTTVRLPERRQQPRMGVRAPERRIWPRHRRWVRSHGCCVPDCRAGAIEFAHLRSAANAGTSQKPHDRFGVSLCRAHHDEQHSLGTDAFDRKYGLDLWGLAAEFARRSPDREMHVALEGLGWSQR